VTPEEAIQVLRSWLPPVTMKSQVTVRPVEAKVLHQAVKVLAAAATAQREETAVVTNQEKAFAELEAKTTRLISETAALSYELETHKRTFIENQATLREARIEITVLTDRLRLYREALAAYRSALRSGETETPQLAALADNALNPKEPA
jgi:septal ring factor EnvC (AmiA/AmiB activator)